MEHNTTLPYQLQSGILVNTRYQVEQLIGQGGMGAVYRAFDQRLKSTVALKQTIANGPRLTEAFEREAQLLARLRHPTLPKVIDYFTEYNGQFLVMEFFPGDDLAQLLLKQRGPFPVEQVLEWADQLLHALAYLHQQDPPVLHRDIKPQNLKLTDTTQREIVLLDFGLAKSTPTATSRLTPEGSVIGYTPMYAPLEQIRAAATVDARSDIYALGATLYHLLTGQPPVDGLTRAAASVSHEPDPQPSPREVNPQVSEIVSAVVAQAMAMLPAERFHSAGAMRHSLKLGREQLETTGRPGRAVPSVSSTRRATTGAATSATNKQGQPLQTATVAQATITLPEEQPAQSLARTDSADSETPHVEAQSRKADAPTEHRQAPLFWPILLIGGGGLWLLATVGVIPPLDFDQIKQFWPILLIFIGVDILTRRWSALLRGVLSFAGALLMIGVVLFATLQAPFATPTSSNAAIQRESFTATGANAEALEVIVDLAGPGPPTMVSAAADLLLQADIEYSGDLEFDPGDEDDIERAIALEVDQDGPILDAAGNPDPERVWDIGVGGEVPLTMNMDAEVAQLILDLRALSVVEISLDARTPELLLQLPGLSAPSADSIEEAVVAIDSDVGTLTIELPTDRAVMIELEAEIDEMRLPEGLRALDNGDRLSWQPVTEASENPILVELDGEIQQLEFRSR